LRFGRILFLILFHHFLLLLRRKLRDPESGKSPDRCENDSRPAQHRPRQIRKRCDAQRSRHVSPGRRPRQDRFDDRGGVFDRPSQVFRMQAAADVSFPQHFARHQDGNLTVARYPDHRQPGDDRCYDEGTRGTNEFQNFIDDKFKRFGKRNRARERDCAETDEQRSHHRVHAAAIEQFRDVRNDFRRIETLSMNHRNVESVNHGADDVMQGKSLENEGVGHRKGGGHQHDRKRRFFPDRSVQYDQYRNDKPEVPMVNRAQRIHDRADFFRNRGACSVRIETRNDIGDPGDDKRWQRRIQKVADVLVQVHARGQRRDIRRIRQRRQLVPEVCTGHDGAGDGSQVGIESCADAHKRYPDRARRPPGCACADGNDGGHEKCGNQQKLRVNDLQSVKNHHRDRAADHPRADHQTNADEDEYRRHRFGDFLRNGLQNIVVAVSKPDRDDARDDR